MKGISARLFGRYAEILIHLVFWTIFISAILNGEADSWKDLHHMYMNAPGIKQETLEAWKSSIPGYTLLLYDALTFIPLVLLFYVNVYFILPMFATVRFWRIVLMVLANLVFSLLMQVALFMLAESLSKTSRINIWDFFDEEYFIVILVLSVVYFLPRFFIVQRMGRLSKVTAELALLRNQVNPHFLFNTLNNLYAMAVEKDAPELAGGISQLTHLMRYNIYESRVPYISLGKEVSYIQDYIRLQSLRFKPEDDIDIVFDVDEADPELQVAPMLFVGFVENAFKHGISLKQHSFIHIRLYTAQKRIHFGIENTIHRRSDTVDVKYAGFGMEHTLRLLELQYPGRYKSEVKEENDIFKVVLEISTR